ncbi:MAG: glycosyltransferase family 2 protein [Nanobdellota archaeon]
MQEPKIAIITSTLNQEESLKKCLKGIRNNTNYKNYKMYFMDDSGTGEIAKRIKKEFPWVDVSANSKNEGYSTSNNLLIKKAMKEYNPDYVLHLDDDTEVIDKNWLREMINFGQENKNVGIIGCKIIYPNGNLQWFFKNGRIHFLSDGNEVEETKDTFGIYELKEVIGACLLIKRKVIEEIGLLDEKFNPAYREESDFCFRAGKKGFKIVYFGKTKMIHKGGSSTKNVKDWIWQIKKRNAIRLEWLNYGYFNIIGHTFIHIGSALFANKPFTKIKMLIAAYKENFKNIKEIGQKRRERNSWKRIKTFVL